MAKVLIVGSGPGALEACLALSRSEHLPGLEISLISPQTEYVYRPNIVVEPFGGQEPARYSVGEIIAAEGVQQWLGTIERIDPGAKKAYSPEGDEFDFDAVIVATGTALSAELPEPAITFGAPQAMEDFKALVADVDAGAVRNVVFTAGPGHFWSLPLYELALMTASRAEQQSNAQVARERTDGDLRIGERGACPRTCRRARRGAAPRGDRLDLGRPHDDPRRRR